MGTATTTHVRIYNRSPWSVEDIQWYMYGVRKQSMSASKKR